MFYILIALAGQDLQVTGVAWLSLSFNNCTSSCHLRLPYMSTLSFLLFFIWHKYIVLYCLWERQHDYQGFLVILGAKAQILNFTLKVNNYCFYHYFYYYKKWLFSCVAVITSRILYTTLYINMCKAVALNMNTTRWILAFFLSY